MDKVSLSVIVPVYNSEKYLDECLQSLFDQGVEPERYEIICIDDGSTDGTADILDKYQKEGKIVLYRQENYGVSAARNVGIKIAKGNYITFVDADDLVLTGTFGKICYAIENELQNVDVFVFGRNMGIEIAPNAYSQQFNFYKTEKQAITSVWRQVIRKALIIDNDISFCKEISMGEDYLFNHQMICHVKNFYQTDYKGYYYRIYPDSSSQSRNIETFRKKANGSYKVAAEARRFIAERHICEEDKERLEDVVCEYSAAALLYSLQCHETKNILRKLKQEGLYPYQRRKVLLNKPRNLIGFLMRYMNIPIVLYLATVAVSIKDVIRKLLRK